MNKGLSVCGYECLACEYFKESKCAGCSEIKGNVWWASYINADVCPIYECVVNEQKHNHCGECGEVPCALWRNLKDPSYTDKQHEASIKKRVGNLKK